MKRTLSTGVRALLGVADHESLQTFAEQRGASLRRGGVRALRLVERLLQGLGIAPPRDETEPGPLHGGNGRFAPSGDLDTRRVAHASSIAAAADGDGDGEGATAPVVARPEPSKFDLGQGIDRSAAREHIPWGYGQDRVSAMPVDPLRLYVYWEVTDDAIAAARAGLGAGGPDAWLALRVYDVSGRIFDGTNAHSYFEQRLERHDRQWFFAIDRPGSSLVVEIGMKSFEGYFVRIARSGRVDFPRVTPAPPGRVEWLTVREATGDVEPSWQTEPPPRPAGAWQPRHEGHGAAPAERSRGDASGALLTGEPYEVERGVRGREWSELLPEHARELAGSGSWTGDVEHWSWEAGPFASPMEAPPRVVEEERPGTVTVQATPGGTRVIYGPWHVTVRGIDARAERRVLARWEMVRTWSTKAGESAASAATWQPVAPGASELALRPGGSERRFGSASETRWGGASEVVLLGASELRYRGASERLYAGASERRWLGASERIAGGASEWRLGGGSERVHAGASEHRFGGASELPRSARESWQTFAQEGARLAAEPAPQRAGGASEQRLAGAVPAPRSELVADGDAPSEDTDPPQPPRW